MCSCTVLITIVQSRFDCLHCKTTSILYLKEQRLCWLVRAEVEIDGECWWLSSLLRPPGGLAYHWAHSSANSPVSQLVGQLTEVMLPAAISLAIQLCNVPSVAEITVECWCGEFPPLRIYLLQTVRFMNDVCRTSQSARHMPWYQEVCLCMRSVRPLVISAEHTTNQNSNVVQMQPFSTSMAQIDLTGSRGHGFLLGQIHLKKNHECYHQVQLHMCICGVQYCDFVIWTQQGLITHVVRDEEMLYTVLPIAEPFFLKKVFYLCS